MENIDPKDLNTDDEAFYRLLGSIIKYFRIKAGFSTPEAFAHLTGRHRSQYYEYESGKNMNILTFRDLLFELGVQVSGWLNFDYLSDDSGRSRVVKEMKKTRVLQVMSQVALEEKAAANVKISPKVAQRYVDILISCLEAKSRIEILSEFELNTSYNTFKRATNKLKEYGWLEMTQKAKNAPNQTYVTTEKGKDVIRLGESLDKNDESKLSATIDIPS